MTDPRIEAVARAINAEMAYRNLGANSWEIKIQNAARAAIEAADKAAWRPIEDLKDETHILAFSAGRGCAVAWWHDKYEHRPAFWTDGIQQLRNITHFMPLPTPPEKEE